MADQCVAWRCEDHGWRLTVGDLPVAPRCIASDCALDGPYLVSVQIASDQEVSRWVGTAPRQRRSYAEGRREYGSGSLYVRTSKHGVRSWYGHWRDPTGRQIKRKLGECAWLSEAEAERRLAVISDGHNPSKPVTG